MTKRAALTLLLLLAFAAPAQALKLIVWDSEMQTKLGAGESSGNKLSVQLVKDYSGPVKVLFSQSADEKSKGLFPGLQSSYDGLLKNGRLSVLPGRDKDDDAPAPRSAAPAPANASDTLPSIGLDRFLQPFKLSVNIQTTSQLDPQNRDKTVGFTASTVQVSTVFGQKQPAPL